MTISLNPEGHWQLIFADFWSSTTKTGISLPETPETSWSKSAVFVGVYLVGLLSVYFKVSSSFSDWLHQNCSCHNTEASPLDSNEDALSCLNTTDRIDDHNTIEEAEMFTLQAQHDVPTDASQDNQAAFNFWGQADDFMDVPIDNLDFIVEMYAILENIKDHVPAFLW